MDRLFVTRTMKTKKRRIKIACIQVTTAIHLSICSHEMCCSVVCGIRTLCALFPWHAHVKQKRKNEKKHNNFSVVKNERSFWIWSLLTLLSHPLELKWPHYLIVCEIQLIMVVVCGGAVVAVHTAIRFREGRHQTNWTICDDNNSMLSLDFAWMTMHRDEYVFSHSSGHTWTLWLAHTCHFIWLQFIAFRVSYVMSFNQLIWWNNVAES